jgi:micrococcal nuclease
MLCIALTLLQCAPEPMAGQVIGISDGDTFTILGEHQQPVRVRLYGVDAPEKSQDYGKAAKQYLSDLIFGKNIELHEIDIDQYGRIVAIVKVDSVVVNEELLSAGMAWHYIHYDHNPKWTALELVARSNHKGLWQQDEPLEPWNFRKAKRHKRH